MLMVANTRAIPVTSSRYSFYKDSPVVVLFSRVLMASIDYSSKRFVSIKKSNMSKSQVAPGGKQHKKYLFSPKVGSYDDFRFAPKQSGALFRRLVAWMYQ